MSSEVALELKELSKCYQIYSQPRDRLKQFILPPLQKAARMQPRQYYREFWALENISFQIKKGETCGIIGRNGSGKSTLLQLICGTLNPTGGSIFTNGRIAALLELGSGFNPEFTGRENIYLNAAVLGLTRHEIECRYDDIVAFADIGNFIEQPVKTYSSGMYVRLAFAVVANVSADILVIDEALAVGDAVFTQKCMRFLRKFRETGTLLFVSHDVGSILNLCDNSVWLHQGKIRQSGQSKKIVEAYLQYTLQEAYGSEKELQSIHEKKLELTIEGAAAEKMSDTKVTTQCPIVDYDVRVHVENNLNAANGWQTGAGEIVAVQLESVTPQSGEGFCGGELVRLTVRARAHQDLARPMLGFLVRDRLGQDLFGENTLPFTNINPLPVSAGSKFSAEYVFRLPLLPNGQYAVTASLADGDLYNNVQHHWLHDALIINVFSSKVRWGLVGVQFESVDFKEDL